MITLITMGQGNARALKRTIESTYGVCDEVVFGDVCIFNEDSIRIADMSIDIWCTQVLLPFNYIFEHGFSKTLNLLASKAKNDIVLYLNVGEVIDSSIAPIRETLSDEYNCYYIDHATEKHRWFRVYNRHEMRWDGLIHEEIVGEHRPYHKPLFRFADTEKDMDDPLRAKVYNDIKELVYFEQLTKIADYPELLGVTSAGWLEFARGQYDYMQARFAERKTRYDAFVEGNKIKYLNDIANNPEFDKERFESSILIEYQGDKKYLI